MDTLTAVRTFAKPGYSPAKRVKLFNDRWYRVRMQNVEHGQGDYIGLGEGEYTELVTGKQARERRDAHLNHCNGIEEYAGPVFEAFASQYGGELRSIGFRTSAELAFDAVTTKKAEHEKWIADCEREAGIHREAAIAKSQGECISLLSVEEHKRISAECLEVANNKREAFTCDIKQIQ